MINLAGLSAAYPGFQAAENTTAETQKNQAAAREAAIKLLGAHALGAALASAAQDPSAMAGAPAGGPQAPPPGQASVPAPRPTMPAPMPPSAATAPPGGPAPPVPNVPAPAAPAPAPAAPPAPPAAQSPEAAGGMGEVTLPALTRRLVLANPGIVNHPEVYLAAIERAAPLLDRQGKEDAADLRKQFTEQRLQLARERLQAAQDHWNQVSQDKNMHEGNVNQRTQFRQDSTEDRFSRTHPNAPAVVAPPPDSLPSASAPFVPTAAMLKPNVVTTFQSPDGKQHVKWTLGPDGQPKQVP